MPLYEHLSMVLVHSFLAQDIAAVSNVDETDHKEESFQEKHDHEVDGLIIVEICL